MDGCIGKANSDPHIVLDSNLKRASCRSGYQQKRLGEISKRILLCDSFVVGVLDIPEAYNITQ